jgi:hypothetical protein
VVVYNKRTKIGFAWHLAGLMRLILISVEVRNTVNIMDPSQVKNADDRLGHWQSLCKKFDGDVYLAGQFADERHMEFFHASAKNTLRTSGGTVNVAFDPKTCSWGVYDDVE